MVKLQGKKWFRFLLIFLISLLAVFHEDIQKLSMPVRILFVLFACLIFIIELFNELQPMKKYTDNSVGKKMYHIICGLDIVLIFLCLVWIFIPLKNSYSFIILVVIAGIGIASAITIDKLEKHNK